MKIRNISLALLITAAWSPVFGQIADTSTAADSLMRALELNEVVISSEQPASKSTRFYQTSKLASTEDILARMEGISLVRRGPVGMEPTLRGFSGGQVSLVLDGMRVFGACTDKMDPLSIYIEPTNLQKIEVGHGAEGLEMGSSLGGSINLSMADAKVSPEPSLRASFTSGYHSAARAFQNTLVTNYSEARWAMRFAGTYRKAGDYTAGNGDRVPFSQYEKANFSLSARYNLSEHTSLKADFIWDDGWNIGYPALPMDVGSAKARIGSLSLKRYFPEGSLDHYEIKTYANSVRHAMDDTQRPDVFMHMDMPGKSQTQGAYFNLNFRPLGKHRFSGKAELFHNYVIADMTMYPQGSEPMYMLTWPGNHQTVAGIFLSDHIMLDESNHLDLYFRSELNASSLTSETGINQLEILGYDVSSTESRWSTGGGLSYKRNIREGYSASLSVGYTERNPTTSERYGFYLYNRMDNRDYIGNPELKKEQSFNLELTSMLSSGSLQWKLSGFTHRVQNYILGEALSGFTPMTYGAEGVRQYQNVGIAYLYGAESNLNFMLNNKLTINNSLKWMRGLEKDGGNLPMISPLKSYTHLRYALPPHAFIQIENEFSLAQNDISATYGELPTPAYSLFNLRTNYHLKLNRQDIEISLGVENIFNTSYYEHLDWGRIMRPGRNIFGMLTIHL